MDHASLIATTTLECVGWLKPASERGTNALDMAASMPESSAVAVQGRLVELVRAGIRRRTPARALREAIFKAINAASAEVVQAVPLTIAVLQRASVRYVMEFETREETIHEIYDFDQLPFISAAWESFRWTGHVRQLPQRQQALVFQVLDAEIDLRNVGVHMQFAQEEGDTKEQEALNAEVAALTLQVTKLRSLLSPDALRAKDEIQSSMSAAEIQRCPAIIETTATQPAAELLSAASAMDRAGDSLAQVLPIDKDTPKYQRRKATAAWARLSNLGNTLHVLAVWLRVLANDGSSRRCMLCYRHIGYRGKNFCSQHQRQGGKRQPAREFHIARRYPEELESLSKQGQDLKAALAQVSARVLSSITADEQSQLPQDLFIPEALVRPAALLFSALRSAAPATDPELKDHIEDTWRQLVRIASEPYLSLGSCSRDDYVVMRVRQEQALRWLNWSTFFRAWWAEGYQGPGPEPFVLTGRAFDTDHPCAQGFPVPPSELVMDLLRQRAWWRASWRVDTEDYLSVTKIGKLIAAGRSLRSVAAELGVSHETVRQTMLHGSITVPTADRRLRLRKGTRSDSAPSRKRP